MTYFYLRSVVQAWFECEDCGYACHHKCISQIIRECAHVVATERGVYELQICPEEGLSAQKYQCAECRTPLPLGKYLNCLIMCSIYVFSYEFLHASAS